MDKVPAWGQFILALVIALGVPIGTYTAVKESISDLSARVNSLEELQLKAESYDAYLTDRQDAVIERVVRSEVKIEGLESGQLALARSTSGLAEEIKELRIFLARTKLEDKDG